MLPVEFPKQRTSVLLVLNANAASGCAMVVVAVAVQLWLSVTVNVYVPDGILLREEAVDPLLHKYVYELVPPVTVDEAFPVELPKHFTSVFDILKTRAAAGCVICVDTVDLHEFASVIVKVYVPAIVFVKFCVNDPLLQA